MIIVLGLQGLWFSFTNAHIMKYGFYLSELDCLKVISSLVFTVQIYTADHVYPIVCRPFSSKPPKGYILSFNRIILLKQDFIHIRVRIHSVCMLCSSHETEINIFYSNILAFNLSYGSFSCGSQKVKEYFLQS